jgi:hypothetical protein
VTLRVRFGPAPAGCSGAARRQMLRKRVKRRRRVPQFQDGHGHAWRRADLKPSDAACRQGDARMYRSFSALRAGCGAPAPTAGPSWPWRMTLPPPAAHCVGPRLQTGGTRLRLRARGTDPVNTNALLCELPEELLASRPFGRRKEPGRPALIPAQGGGRLPYRLAPQRPLYRARRSPLPASASATERLEPAANRKKILLWGLANPSGFGIMSFGRAPPKPDLKKALTGPCPAREGAFLRPTPHLARPPARRSGTPPGEPHPAVSHAQHRPPPAARAQIPKGLQLRCRAV